MSTSTNSLRINGMATGMDTDTVVKQLMKPYQTQLDKLNQNKQLIQWKQDAYRSFLEDMNSFKSTYFDILKPDSYMLSKNSYTNFQASVFETGTTTISSGVSIIANADAVAGTYNINFNGGSLAKSAGLLSDSSISGAKSTTLLKDLGITSTSIKINYSDAAGVAAIPIDIDIDPNTLTLGGLASAINSKTSGAVSAAFSEITGKFKLSTKETGLLTSVGITDNTNGKFLEGLNLAGAGSGATTVNNSNLTYGLAGSNLSVKITVPGQTETTITNMSNSFTADGISFNFTSMTKNVDVTISANTQKTFDKIKAFIDKYNEMIDKIGSKIEEKKQFSYLPLTADQKESMKDTDITNWETKAKVGLVSKDSGLQNMLYSMRDAFYSTVKDSGISLSDIGLSTSVDTTQRGKILIDETKLKTAITNNPDKINDLFSKTSTTHTTYDPDLTNAQRKVRFDEEGIFQRIQDVLLDYTRTNRNANGQKGILVEKAGIKGDFSEYNNLLSKDLINQQKLIDRMTQRMSDKQERYYLQFAKLESAMNASNAQSSWLSQQVSSMNG